MVYFTFYDAELCDEIDSIFRFLTENRIKIGRLHNEFTPCFFYIFPQHELVFQVIYGVGSSISRSTNYLEQNSISIFSEGTKKQSKQEIIIFFGDFKNYSFNALILYCPVKNNQSPRYQA